MEVPPNLCLLQLKQKLTVAQASTASRKRPADLLDRKRLYISGHFPSPGSVHLSYTSGYGISDS